MQNHAFSDASMKLGINVCQVIQFCKNPLATRNFKMAAIFQDGRHFQDENSVLSIYPDIIDRF